MSPRLANISTAILLGLSLGLAFTFINERARHRETLAEIAVLETKVANRITRAKRIASEAALLAKLRETPALPSDEPEQVNARASLNLKATKSQDSAAIQPEPKILKELIENSPRVALAEIVSEVIVEKADKEAGELVKTFSLDEEKAPLLAAEISALGEQVRELLLQTDDLTSVSTKDFEDQLHAIGQDAEQRAIEIIGPEKYQEQAQHHSQELLEKRQEMSEKSADDLAVLENRLNLEPEQLAQIQEILKLGDDYILNNHSVQQYHAMVCVECLAKRVKALHYFQQKPDGSAEFDYEKLLAMGPIVDSAHARKRLVAQQALEKLPGVLSQEQLTGMLQYVYSE